MNEKWIVIVDGYSAGNLLAPEFKSRGYRVAHVQSTREIWKVLLPTFRPDDFDQKFIFENNETQLLQSLALLAPHGIIPGTETGVELADTLSAKLNLKSNGLKHSSARRNKYEMGETVRSAGLRAARQYKSDSAQDLCDWFQKQQLTKVVVKPLNSAGTDHVAVCTSVKEVERAANAILGQTNMLGLWNQEALIQEFLEGTEYFLNAVSLNGKHHFTEIWRYWKRSINGHDCVYDRNELVGCDELNEKQLCDYVAKVLDALGVKYGPSHTEVMLTKEGPALVEIGTRLDGLSVPSVNQACIGYSPVDLTADAYTNPDQFYEKASHPFRLRKKAYTVYFTSYEAGEVSEIPGEATIKELPSFFQIRLRVKPRSLIKKTTDYFTAPGFCTLVHEDPQQLERDYQIIRALENNGGLFQIRPQ